MIHDVACIGGVGWWFAMDACSAGRSLRWAWMDCIAIYGDPEMTRDSSLPRRLVVTVRRLFGMPLWKQTVDVTRFGKEEEGEGRPVAPCMLCKYLCSISDLTSALVGAILHAVCGRVVEERE
jgi:hypothetical protein